ncbi:MAG TPA: patatin-like phospholipase family protein [Agromyces sp.]
MSAKVAFVLGGGGVLGAVQVGMLRAVLERGIRPDLVVGTSIGAINGAIVAADVDRSVLRLDRAWTSSDARVLTTGLGVRPGRAHLMSSGPLLRLLEGALPHVRDFDDLEVEFRCCAASIERAAEHWFAEGPLVPAVLASAALPGVFPAVRIGDEHFVDGGIVNSIPVSEAAAGGATDIYVMQVGRIEFPLTAPRNQFENARVAFEISRRHRFARDTAALPAGTRLHVLPTGTTSERDNRIVRNLSPAAVRRRIESAHRAASAYLDRTAAAPAIDGAPA